jgi:hypothetical protein
MRRFYVRPVDGPVGSIVRSQPSSSKCMNWVGLASTHWLILEDKV